MPRSLHPSSVFPCGLVIDHVEVGTGLPITARSVAALARCPGCDQPSSRIHSRYTRTLRTFKRSRDPAFVEKVEDVVGLYMDPPAHAVVLSIDEKSQIQALERTRPDRPLGPGHPAAQTHDYTRHGTTTLFAALNVLEGPCLDAACSAIATASSSASSTRSRRPCRRASSST